MILSKRNSLSLWNIDKGISALLSLCAILSAALFLLIICFLIIEAYPVLSHGKLLNFITDNSWYPLEGQFGVMPMIVASMAMMVGAVILAVPLGLASAIFIMFYAPNVVAHIYRMILNLLAGIPSVVYGLWGLTELVPLITQFQPPGASLLAAILVLTLMILPTVAIISIAALQGVPQNLFAGAAALGMTRKAKILSVMLPAARNGILGGVLLAMVRALGETMAVLMVAGNVVQYPSGLFTSVRAITANIALEMPYATDIHRSSLFASGLMLTLMVLLLSWIAARMMSRGAVNG